MNPQHAEALPSVIAELRHLYANMVNGAVKDGAQAKRIAEGLLSRQIERLERLAAPHATAEQSEAVAGWKMVPYAFYTADQMRAYADADRKARATQAGVSDAFEAAMKQTWQMIDPLRPPAAGTYALGEHNGIAAALKTVRQNFERALAQTEQPEAAESITIQEAWNASGGNQAYRPTKEELLHSLRILDQVCEEAAATPSAPPSIEHEPGDVSKKAPEANMSTAPARIYLDIGDRFALERVQDGTLPWDKLAEVTWSADNATGHGIEYVRADVAASPAAPAPCATKPAEPFTPWPNSYRADNESQP
ncbi:hypothetical protein [Xenophilus sp. Marseille-Q4582]|uniref:hypothetical protein n=1 Tax=Xenophilus sp. Marseille-Q4582 TaxID=2866600 RepID=UPI001CE3C41D|nr:hypothetical protein [Xenophilus sp. Marseille-Q4582]